MTPERLEHIRNIAHDLSGYESGDLLRELLSELDRLRAAADGLKRATFEDHENSMVCRNVTRPVESLTWHQYNAMGGAFRQVLDKGRELGLWK